MLQSLWQQKCGFSLNHSSEDEGGTASQSEPTKVTTNITLEDELFTLSVQDTDQREEEDQECGEASGGQTPQQGVHGGQCVPVPSAESPR